MGSKLSILVDVNVVLDVLAKRNPYYAASARVWAAVETGQAVGFLAAHSITTLFYLLSKYTSHQQAHIALVKLLQVFSAAGVDQQVIFNALAMNWRDFEDAVQMAAAINVGVDYLVTRNPKDFKDDVVGVLQPGDLLALLQASYNDK